MNALYDGIDQLLLLKARLRHELGANLISDFVMKLAKKIGDRLLKLTARESFESIFEFLSCYLLAFKLRYGLNDGAANTEIVEALSESFKS